MSSNTNIATYPLAVMKPVKEPTRYTLGAYLQREEYAKELHEYYNGIIIKLPMAKGPHNIIVANMSAELIFAFRTNNKDFTVMGSQQLVYLPDLNFSLYPDVLTVAQTPQYWDKNEVLLINPLLIVEVLSRSTKKYDQNGKFDEYKTLPSFKAFDALCSRGAGRIVVDAPFCNHASRATSRNRFSDFGATVWHRH